MKKEKTSLKDLMDTKARVEALKDELSTLAFRTKMAMTCIEENKLEDALKWLSDASAEIYNIKGRREAARIKKADEDEINGNRSKGTS